MPAPDHFNRNGSPRAFRPQMDHMGGGNSGQRFIRVELTTHQSKETKRDLPCILTDSEKLEYGRRLADAENEDETITAELEKAKSEFKARTNAVSVAIRRYVSAIRDGIERREVDCDWIYHWDTLAKELIRRDTGEVITTEPIGMDERQMGLDVVDPATAAE